MTVFSLLACPLLNLNLQYVFITFKNYLTNFTFNYHFNKNFYKSYIPLAINLNFWYLFSLQGFIGVVSEHKYSAVLR
jgi:hypothetical protein